MTVEIGDGRVDTIRVHEDDDLEDLARQFVRKHDLDVNIIDPLKEHISANVWALAKSNIPGNTSDDKNPSSNQFSSGIDTNSSRKASTIFSASSNPSQRTGGRNNPVK